MQKKLFISILLSLPGLLFAQGYSKSENNPLLFTEPYLIFVNEYNFKIPESYLELETVKPKKKHKTKSYRNKNGPRELKPFGVNIIAGGPSLIGASFEYFITPFLNIELGGGYYGVYSGPKYHIAAYRKDPWTPYFGIQGTYAFEGKAGIYIPGGFQYIGNYGFSFSFEFALWMEMQELETDPIGSLEYLGMLGLKAGYRF